mgnify:CR=1 FL=1|tara:strand:+ start:6319 stop:6513 length:195 start_codon:yes stop_codon:yes gene_type:complete
MTKTEHLITALGNLCGVGAQYNWTCFDEDEAGDPKCASSDTKCVWCDARKALFNADPVVYEGGE